MPQLIHQADKGKSTRETSKREASSEKSLHSPNLSTVLMVEDTLKDAGELISVAELKRRLPKKVMHQTLMQILDYLEEKGMIIDGRKGILWVYTPSKKLQKAIEEGTEI